MKAFLEPYGTPASSFKLSEPKDGEACMTCHQSAQAELLLVSVVCPSCSKPLSTHQPQNRIVAEGPSGENSERYARVPVVKCSSCSSLVALWPTPINYNADHEVLYTGAGKYLSKTDAKATDELIRGALHPQIAQFFARYGEEANLGPDHLEVWLVYAVQAMFSRALRDAGLLPGGVTVPEEMIEVLRDAAEINYCLCPSPEECDGSCPGQKARNLLLRWGIQPNT